MPVNITISILTSGIFANKNRPAIGDHFRTYRGEIMMKYRHLSAPFAPALDLSVVGSEAASSTCFVTDVADAGVTAQQYSDALGHAARSSCAHDERWPDFLFRKLVASKDCFNSM